MIEIALAVAAGLGAAGWAAFQIRRRHPNRFEILPTPREAIGLPVFMFHDAPPETLEACFRHLAVNGYRTIGADDCLAVLSGRRPPVPGEVVLTFDDGLRSLWAYADPLLERHGLRAVAFVCPSLFESSPPRPTLREVWSGGADASRIAPVFWKDHCSREEILALDRGGRVEIASHSWGHEACFRGTPGPDGTAIRRESMRRARVELEDLLRRRVVHFASPFGGDSDLLREEAREAGYATNFGVLVRPCGLFRRANGPGTDPFGITRTAFRGIRSLPGTGRLGFTGRLLYALKHGAEYE